MVRSKVSIDDIVKLLDAITKLLNTLAWPAIFLFVLIRFGRDLGDFITSLGELSVKGAGFEASVKRTQAEIAAALAAAAASRSREDIPGASTAQEAKIAADVVSEGVTPRMIRRARRASILWVDDRPDNTLYERQALAALGINFVLAVSTEDALKKIAKQRFDAIISDMGRPPDPRAGYTLLDQLQTRGDHVPVIIYTSSRAPEHVIDARRHGAMGQTNNANELFEMVLLALDRSR